MARPNYIRVLAVLTAMLAAALMAVLLSHATAEAQTATDTLKQPPFPPTDTSLFTTSAYPDSPPMVPASSGPTDEATLRGLLSDLLTQRFPSSPKTVDQALAVFDSQSTKAVVTDPRLRAALVALKGTAGERAIAGVLDGTYSTVRFTPLTSGIAQAVFPQGEGNPGEIQLNDKYQYEDFRVLAHVIAHEALHRDRINSTKEELVAGSIDTLVYGQFLLESPELATSGTELTRRRNTALMARINTRDEDGEVRLFVSNGDDILPGGNPDPLPSFGASFGPLGDDTPGSPVLKTYLKKVVPAKKVPRRPHFNDKTVLLLDTYQRVFTAAEIVQLAQILKLDISPPSSAIAAQRAQQEATTSDQPIPDWREIFGEQ